MTQAVRLDLPGCANLLEVPVRRLQHAVRSGQFPQPAGYEEGRPYWYARHAYEWAISAAPELAGRIPLTYWPDSSEHARFRGARDFGDRPDVALGWDIPGLGTILVVWPFSADTHTAAQIVASAGDAAAVVVVEYDFAFDGPSVRGVLPAARDHVEYTDLSWTKVAAVIGGPLPYWPSPMRIPALLHAWRPGAPTVVAPAQPDLDVVPLLRLAAALDDDSPAQQVLVNLARISQHRETSSAEGDLRLVAESTRPGTTVVAARPMPAPDADLEDLDASLRRAGWLEILGRDDTLAAACVHQKVLWDGGKDFPSSNPETINPDDSPPAAEWARRLRPVLRTARFEQLDPDQTAAQTLIDPETDAPVIRRGNNTLRAAVPQRLPATSPLAELILDQPVWVRTEDGTLYLAPKDSYWGLNWGYGGSGPGALAVLANRLLGDINAVAADNVSDAPEGLHALMQTAWPRGTVLTRAQLEAARDEG